LTLSAQDFFNYLELIRLKYGLTSLLLVYLAYILSSQQYLLTLQLIWALLAAFLVVSASSALDNYVDAPKDLVNNPDRALPRDKIKRTHALYFAIVLFALATLFSALAGLKALLISNLTIIAVFAHQFFIKKRYIYLRIIFPGLFAALVVLFGAVIGDNMYRIIWLALSLFFAVTADMLILELKSFVNKEESWLSLPKRKGRDRTALLNILFTSLFVAVSPLPYLVGILSYNYLLVMAVADLLLLYAAVKILTEEHAIRESYKLERIGIFFFLLGWMTALI